MEESQFDVIVFGTGLVNSITAAALSKCGYKVAHIDSNPYYGGDEASLSLEELVKWADRTASSNAPSRFQRLTRSVEVPSQSRQYSICLQPGVIPSVGPLISSLVSSGVAKYSGFRLLEAVIVYDSTGVKNVPGSKEDIFKSKEISLLEKRRLMRFLTFAATDFEDKKELEGMEDMPFLEFLPKVFSLGKEITSVIGYSLAFCMSSTEPTLPTLQRLRNYLRSGGRYGASPFLIGDYGGIGDIAQGFCRASAVCGGVYILSRAVQKISRLHPESTDALDTPPTEPPSTFNYTVDLDDFPDTLSCKLIISSLTYVPPELQSSIYQFPSVSPGAVQAAVNALARCILIIDEPLVLRSPPPPQEPDQGPESTEHGTSNVHQDGTQVPAPAAADRAIDTAIVVFPPSSVDGGSETHPVTVLINGESSLSTPKGKWLAYITLPLGSIPEEPITAESLLRPYVDALLRLAVNPSRVPLAPLFSLFYLEVPDERVLPSEGDPQASTYLVPAALPIASLPDFPDQATTVAEATFRAAVQILQKLSPPRENEGEEESTPFWPPLPTDEDDEDSEW
ncbi:hypothetical protein HYPSUDRAFT_175261 [Hypholoma sublateritium FD-334 SS-4]|uniref:Rab proteins geranylgeranyltransferase n=1 Tax=Hypholoma sublateritium (strain FD-334 SS-4) TaxID=945553 RepID=A0A0D2N123_HYPSF|nr:hypothetical protein HYPSUDRAFT_175261 [Hypholoma sublateritium FD-334 SS-4]